MWRKIKHLSTLLTLVASFLLLPFAGICSANQMYQISESELTTLSNHLTALEQNNEMLKSILSESGSELTTALDMLKTSNEELTRLKAELQMCKSEAESARSSLKTANEELLKAKESFMKCEAAHDKTEGRLRTQRTIWQVVACVLVGVAAAR